MQNSCFGKEKDKFKINFDLRIKILVNLKCAKEQKGVEWPVVGLSVIVTWFLESLHKRIIAIFAKLASFVCAVLCDTLSKHRNCSRSRIQW